MATASPASSASASGRPSPPDTGAPAASPLTFTVEPGTADAPDAALAGSLEALAGLVSDGRDLDDAVREGEVSVSGDRDAARRLLTLFTFPDEVAPPTN